jgi:hypothetical protein
MGTHVNPGSLNHQKESFSTGAPLLKRLQGNFCHLVQGGLGLVVAVNLEIHMAGMEQAHGMAGQDIVVLSGQRIKLVLVEDNVFPAIVFALLDQIAIVQTAAPLGSVGQEEAAATPQHQIDLSPKGIVSDLLDGNVGLHITMDHMS